MRRTHAAKVNTAGPPPPDRVSSSARPAATLAASTQTKRLTHEHSEASPLNVGVIAPDISERRAAGEAPLLVPDEVKRYFNGRVLLVSPIPANNPCCPEIETADGRQILS